MEKNIKEINDAIEQYRDALLEDLKAKAEEKEIMIRVKTTHYLSLKASERLRALAIDML